MARTTLSVQQVVVAGLNPSYTAANADGHSFDNNGQVLFYAENNDASSVTVTFQTPLQVGGVDVAELAVAVPGSGGVRMIGPFAPAVFNQSGGVVYVDFSAVTSLTVAAIQLGS